MVVDGKTGKVRQSVPIGEDCDGVYFAPSTDYVFVCAGGGKLTVIHADSSGKYGVVQNLDTPPSTDRSTTRGMKLVMMVRGTRLSSHPSPQLSVSQISRIEFYSQPTVNREGNKVGSQSRADTN